MCSHCSSCACLLIGFNWVHRLLCVCLEFMSILAFPSSILFVSYIPKCAQKCMDGNIATDVCGQQMRPTNATGGGSLRNETAKMLENISAYCVWSSFESCLESHNNISCVSFNQLIISIMIAKELVRKVRMWSENFSYETALARNTDYIWKDNFCTVNTFHLNTICWYDFSHKWFHWFQTHLKMNPCIYCVNCPVL